MVSADDGITLCECEIDILRQHAFSLLSLKPGATDQIRIQSLTVKQPEDKSMQFQDRTKVNVSGLRLGIPCQCDVASRLTGGDPNQSQWFSQTRCESNDTTRPTLAEFHRENCPDPTTTTTTPTTSTTSSSNGVMGDDAPPVTMAGPSGPLGSQPIRTDDTNTWILVGVVIGLIICLILGIAICAMLGSPRKRHGSIWRRVWANVTFGRRTGQQSSQSRSEPVGPTYSERRESCGSGQEMIYGHVYETIRDV